MTKWDIEETLLAALGLDVKYIRKIVLTLEFDALPLAVITTNNWPPANDEDEVGLTTTCWEFGTKWTVVSKDGVPT